MKIKNFDAINLLKMGVFFFFFWRGGGVALFFFFLRVMVTIEIKDVFLT